MEELRIEIWDVLYRAGGAVSISDLAKSTGSSEEEVREAVSHAWFELTDESVQIAETTQN